MSKPSKPDNDDCCGGGCCPCVWDTYFNQLDLWQEQKVKAAEDDSIASENETEL
ncbi:MAG: oxidoreductase-like domain-containing protein [Cycloclasticus sp.]